MLEPPSAGALDILKDYAGVIALCISMASLLTTLYLTRLTQRISVRPALIFSYSFEAGWQIANIGSGPAMNIVILFRDYSVGVEVPPVWIKPVRIPPLKKDGVYPLHWSRDENRYGLGAIYEDLWERPYSTTCSNDLNVTKPGNQIRVAEEQEIELDWRLMPGYADAQSKGVR